MFTLYFLLKFNTNFCVVITVQWLSWLSWNLHTDGELVWFNAGFLFCSVLQLLEWPCRETLELLGVNQEAIGLYSNLVWSVLGQCFLL